LGNPVDLSILGNPFWMNSEAERDDVCNKYRAHLYDHIKRNTTVAAALRLIPDDAVLGCFCAPRRCHCHSIADAVAWLKQI